MISGAHNEYSLEIPIKISFLALASSLLSSLLKVEHLCRRPKITIRPAMSLKEIWY